MKSVWMVDGATAGDHGSLDGAIEVDTVVVGGGITGVTTALRLHEAGQRVAVLEADAFGASNTGRSTGNLYGTLSAGLAPLREKWGGDIARDVVTMRMQAVERIEQTVARLAIDCGFARRPLYTGVAGGDDSQLTALEQEFSAAEYAGLAPQWLDRVPELPVSLQRAMLIDNQAQFNPYTYTRALAHVLSQRGARLYERSAVVEIDAGNAVVRTEAGEVRAQQIVLATHTPKGFNLVQAEMEACREYGISATLGAAGRPPEGIFWVRDRERSIRSYRADGRHYLVIVGEKHKTGRGESGVDYAERLRETARAHFDVATFEHQWSAQQYKPADGLPYIGVSAHDNVYIATGFAADGLTWGTVAADVISGLIQGRPGRASELLTPRRFTPVKSAKAWATENTTVIRHLVGDRLSSADTVSLAAVGPGEGRIVDLEGGKHAVYRSADGELSVLSPVCPHMKCHVAWNASATSWDCPCHGSRFDTEGRVIEGPSLQPLARRIVDAD